MKWNFIIFGLHPVCVHRTKCCLYNKNKENWAWFHSLKVNKTSSIPCPLNFVIGMITIKKTIINFNTIQMMSNYNPPQTHALGYYISLYRGNILNRHFSNFNNVCVNYHKKGKENTIDWMNNKPKKKYISKLQ